MITANEARELMPTIELLLNNELDYIEQRIKSAAKEGKSTVEVKVPQEVYDKAVEFLHEKGFYTHSDSGSRPYLTLSW